jgi:hypothetical protein
MTRREQELLRQTRFYKGEEDCTESPYVTDGQSASYWDYEHVWVKWEMEQDEGYTRLLIHFLTQIQKDQPVYPSVPLGLQAIFASRINYWNGGREPVTLKDVHQFCDKYVQAYAEVQNQKQ